MIFFHRGYTGSVTCSDWELRGKVDCSSDLVTYGTQFKVETEPCLDDVERLYHAFCVAVDDYIETREAIDSRREHDSDQTP